MAAGAAGLRGRTPGPTRRDAGSATSVARFRPIPQSDPVRPAGALPLAGGPLWFSQVAEHRRDEPPLLRAADTLPEPVRLALCAPRAAICGLTLDRPRLMGVLNVTPDSFSDGGAHSDLADAVAHGRAMLAAGADLIDIGGESTRPGAEPVPLVEELARVIPVIVALRASGVTAPISVDTRKAAVARAAVDAGADLINDVSALTHDPACLAFAARAGTPVCLMHAQGDPHTMQDAPRYDDVLLDVYAYLEARVAAAEAGGIARARILVDPGIGFGKTGAHNLELIRGLALFHGLGCALLLGASRKRFIGVLGGATGGVIGPSDRLPGSLAVALEGLRQGAQVLRVHDAGETRQAAALWTALNAATG